MSELALRHKLRTFVEQRFPVVTTRRLADDDSLLASGVIDSLGILELVAFIESDLGLQLADDEILPQYFDSIESVARFLGRKAAEAKVAASP